MSNSTPEQSDGPSWHPVDYEPEREHNYVEHQDGTTDQGEAEGLQGQFTAKVRGLMTGLLASVALVGVAACGPVKHDRVTHTTAITKSHGHSSHTTTITTTRHTTTTTHHYPGGSHTTTHHTTTTTTHHH